MINNIINYLENNSINNKKIIVAVSGGPDSICLLYLLFNVKEKFNINIEAAYVSHGIRSNEENLEDYKLIQKHCDLLNIKLHIQNIPYGEIQQTAKSLKKSIEVVARDIRYSFFKTLTKHNDLIAVGHNRDDQIETQLMRIFQGSSIDGLLGIKHSRDNIIRPLINVDKSKILQYLDENKIAYLIDKSNLELDYLRNKIRISLIPQIKEIFPGYKKGLENFSLELKRYKDVVDDIYTPLVWFKKNSCFETNFSQFEKLPFIKRKDEVYKIFNISYLGEYKSLRLPKRFLLSLNKSSFKDNEIILEGHGIRLFRASDKLIWTTNLRNKFFFNMIISEIKNYRNSLLDINISYENIGLFIPNITLPFTIRNIKEGYPEINIIKKFGVMLHNYNKIIIVEKENHVYAIIYNGALIYCKETGDSGLYINLN
ncbi:MAG: tRNA lysidine(34) synthetase TilS [Spirochaetaceae bacterium]